MNSVYSLKRGSLIIKSVASYDKSLGVTFRSDYEEPTEESISQWQQLFCGNGEAVQKEELIISLV